jgi:ribonuclease III
VRGLPALVRAVPAFPWLRSRRTDILAPAGGSPSLLALVRQLPPSLLELALTHSSWVDERTESYERLEFLGDSVLGLAIASALYGRYPDSDEGDLARAKAFVVSRASCVKVARALEIDQLLIEHAPAPERKRVEAANNRTILGNVLEALIGAVYLAHGFGPTLGAVIEAFERQIHYAVTPQGLQPVYRLVAEAGPAHARVFTSEVLVDGSPRGRGTGTTIKMSEQAAAGEALAALGEGEEG